MFIKKYHWILIKKEFKKLKSLVEKYRSNLTKKEVDYLTKFQWQSSNIFCTPKVHKRKIIQKAIALSTDDYIEVFQLEDLKARPIVSGTESPTERLSCLIENLLKPIVPFLTTDVKDNLDFLRFLPISLNFDSVLFHVTFRVYILPNYLGIEAIDY